MKRAELAEHFVELNFMPQDACRWLSPSELRTFAAQTLSQIFGNYADKRELQKVFDSNLIQMPPPTTAAPRRATSGSTTPPTSATASRRRTRWRRCWARSGSRSTASTPHCRAGRCWCSAATRSTRRASSKAYEDRMVGPYRSAMPEARPSR